MGRPDQRAKGELYLRRLLLDGKRKLMRTVAVRVGVYHQPGELRGSRRVLGGACG